MILVYKEWRAKLKGSSLKIKVFSDHKNIKYFIITKHFNYY